MTRHPLDALSLLFGAAFVVLGGATLALSEVPLGWVDPRWVAPAVAVAVGAWLLVTSRRRASHDDGKVSSQPSAHGHG